MTVRGGRNDGKEEWFVSFKGKIPARPYHPGGPSPACPPAGGLRTSRNDG
jgi:hypothetical protein